MGHKEVESEFVDWIRLVHKGREFHSHLSDY
jgi:hypothetical protein